jgi:murein DD-endopeptidase MepM/ murein hydrolase activator NlpD
MQSVSGDRLAVALAREGGVSFIYGSQSIEDEAAMVARAKSYKAGFVVSDSNVTPESTLADILELKAKNGYSTVYAHMSKIYVKKGDKVTAGQVIGACGHTGVATGNHVHFEIKINGTAVNPAPYLGVK